MYSTDPRKRMSNYDRMRIQQEKISSLLNKSHSIKEKLKSEQKKSKKNSHDHKNHHSIPVDYNPEYLNPKKVEIDLNSDEAITNIDPNLFR